MSFIYSPILNLSLGIILLGVLGMILDLILSRYGVVVFNIPIGQGISTNNSMLDHEKSDGKSGENPSPGEELESINISVT